MNHCVSPPLSYSYYVFSLVHLTTIGSRSISLINFSDVSFDKKNILGYGSFSKVYRGSYSKLASSKECAIKLVFTMDLTEDDIYRVVAEATILSAVTSVNVVRIYGVMVMPPSLCLVLELCSFGSLSDVVRKPPKALTLSAQDRLFLCLGCAR